MLKEIINDPPITPLTYKIPDYWKKEDFSCGSHMFLSESKRFDEPRQNRVENGVQLLIGSEINNNNLHEFPRPKSSEQIYRSKIKGYSFRHTDTSSPKHSTQTDDVSLHSCATFATITKKYFVLYS